MNGLRRLSRIYGIRAPNLRYMMASRSMSVLVEDATLSINEKIVTKETGK